MEIKPDKNFSHRCTGIAFIVLLICTTLIQSSCKKYLEKKPLQDLAVPSSLSDLQAILDNQSFNASSPGDLEFVADNYYLTTSSWLNADIGLRKSYIWAGDATVTAIDVWMGPYNSIYQANFVLDALPTIHFDQSETNSFNNVKGTALFYRSFMFYQLAQLFCKPFTATASTDPGIVLRLAAETNSHSVRATVRQTYDQIITDLKSAASLLPVTTLSKIRPNKAAAYGMLARVYLSMREYADAGSYADSCLALTNILQDYNSLVPAGSPVLPRFTDNPEVLFLSYEGISPRLLFSHEELIDSLLYQSYNSSDLRKKAFFASDAAGVYYWHGSYYSGISTIFDGIATDEVYLIRSETKARAGDTNGAMADLNTLLRNRWETGTFTDLTAIDPADALSKILVERRKELLFRGLRWSDLRRFNLEGANITLKRIVNGITYILPPNDLRWVLLIPDLEISRSGITQNSR